MQNAFLSLMGSLLGGIVTLTVAYFGLRRDREKQEREFAEQRGREERLFSEERRKLDQELAREWAHREAQNKQERETLRNAVEAELKRVEDVVERQWKYVWDPEAKKVRPGAEANHLNWTQIHTPIWDSVVAHGKVGLLPTEDAQLWTWFFGYVRWMNSDLLPLYTIYKDEKRLPEYAVHVAVAFETLLQGGWRPQKVSGPPTAAAS